MKAIIKRLLLTLAVAMIYWTTCLSELQSNSQTTEKPAAPLKQAVENSVSQKQKETSAHKKYKYNSAEIFVIAECSYCDQVVRYLKNKNIRYKTYDIQRYPANLKRYTDIGGKGEVPLTKIGRTVVSGFDPQALEDALYR